MSDTSFKWEYSPDTNLKVGPNPAAQRNFDERGRYTSLAREVIQNSLDAKLDDSKVELTFEVIQIKPNDLPDVEGLRKMIEACKLEEDEPVNKKVKSAIDCLDSVKIKVLKIHEVSGTKGMAPTDRKGKEPYLGAPFEESDLHNFFFAEGGNNKGQNDMGSNGIGKNAYMAPSMIDTVIASTKFHDKADKKDKTSIIGQTKFMTSRQTESSLFKNSIWYLCNREKDSWNPIESQELDSRYSWLKREEDSYGTTFYILGIEDDDWKDQVAIATMSSFFLGILRDNLRVKVGNIEINSNTIEQQLDTYDTDKLKNIIKDKNTINEFNRIKYFIKCYKDPVYEDVINVSTVGNCNIKLYDKIEEDSAPGLFKHVVLVRRDFVVCRCDQSDAAIKLNYQSFSRTKRFVAIITPDVGNTDLSGQRYIRKLENASHTNLDPKRLESEGEEAVQKAERFLADITKKAKDWIKKCIGIEDSNDDLDLSFIADILPIELESDTNKDKESKINPETQELKSKTSGKTRKLVSIPGLINDGDDGYPERDKKGKKKKTNKKQPPWSGGDLIKINSFKFIRTSENVVNVNLILDEKGPVALRLEYEGLAKTSDNGIKILECDGSDKTIETHENNTWVLFDVKKTNVNLKIKIKENIDLSNIAIVPTMFHQRTDQ